VKRLRVADVMTRDVVSVTPETGYQKIADVLVSRRVSAVPVVDADRRVVGVVAEADLLAKLEYADRVPRHALAVRRLRADWARTAGDRAYDLMSTPAVTIRADATVSRAARLLDAARVKRLPVVDDDSRLVGVVSRRDLVHLYARPDDQIRASVVEDVVGGLGLPPGTIDVQVRAGVVTLRGAVDRHATTMVLVSFTQATPGVVDVVDELTYTMDDVSAAV
jgi:CBS-domain-containing membrane protein